jgi:hypothetical protein
LLDLQEKQSMRRPLILTALALPLVLCAAPTLALDRPAMPAGSQLPIIRIADLDRPADYRAYRGDAHGNWRYRAAYSRWLHNEYKASGYPVRHPHYRVYARAWPCCQERSLRRWW